MCSKVATLSSNQANLQNSDFLAFADLVVDSLCSEILSAREEYLVYSEPFAIAAGQSQARIPYRSINGTVRHLWWEDGTGQRFRLWSKMPEQLEYYNSLTSIGTPDSFYVQGNYLYLLPTPITAGTLMLSYPFRPNDLTDVSNAQQIISFTGSTASVANIPSTWTSGALYDVIDHRSGNGIIAYDLTGTTASNTITFNKTLVGLAQVGNYIAPAGTTPVPMLPEEAHGLLLEQTVLRVEILRGNAARIKNSAALVQDARKSFDRLLSNRVISKAHPAGGMNPNLPLRPY